MIIFQNEVQYFGQDYFIIFLLPPFLLARREQYNDPQNMKNPPTNFRNGIVHFEFHLPAAALSWFSLVLVISYAYFSVSPSSFLLQLCVCVCAWPCPRSSFGRKGFKIYSFYKFIEKSNRFSFSIFSNKRYVSKIKLKCT